MMLNLLKNKNPYEASALSVYAAILGQTREPVFYADMAVPDTLDGRFDLLVLHAFIVIYVTKEFGEDGMAFNQALFDAVFINMDQALRQKGIGDMGIPKHMKRMMKAFNGRMHSYEEALEQGEATFDAVLARNVFGTVEEPAAKDLAVMRKYAQVQIEHVKAKTLDEIMTGNDIFTAV